MDPNQNYIMHPSFKFKAHLTLEERTALGKFKDAMDEDDDCDFDEDIHSDNLLIRFLRARKLDIPKTLLMFKEYLKFREEYKVDTIIQDFVFTERNELLKLFPTGYHGVDKIVGFLINIQGRPLYFQCLGGIDIDSINKVTTEDRLLKYLIQENEVFLRDRLAACCNASNKYISQFFAIYDLKGESASLMNKKVIDFMKKSSGFLQNFYPEVLGITFVINTSAIFRGLWAIIKGFLDERTVAKIVIKGDDFLTELLEHVSIHAKNKG